MTILKKIITLKKSLRKVIKLKAMILVQHMCLFFFPLMRTSCTPSSRNMVFLGGQFVMIRLQTFLHYGEIWFLRFGLCEEFSHPWFISTFNACYINSKGSFNILLSPPHPHLLDEWYHWKLYHPQYNPPTLSLCDTGSKMRRIPSCERFSTRSICKGYWNGRVKLSIILMQYWIKSFLTMRNISLMWEITRRWVNKAQQMVLKRCNSDLNTCTGNNMRDLIEIKQVYNSSQFIQNGV